MELTPTVEIEALLAIPKTDLTEDEAALLVAYYSTLPPDTPFELAPDDPWPC